MTTHRYYMNLHYIIFFFGNTTQNFSSQTNFKKFPIVLHKIKLFHGTIKPARHTWGQRWTEIDWTCANQGSSLYVPITTECVLAPSLRPPALRWRFTVHPLPRAVPTKWLALNVRGLLTLAILPAHLHFRELTSFWPRRHWERLNFATPRTAELVAYSILNSKPCFITWKEDPSTHDWLALLLKRSINTLSMDNWLFLPH